MGISLLIRILIALFLSLLNKSGSNFKDGFEQKPKEKRKEKLETDY